MLAVDIEKIPFYQDGLKKGIETVAIGMLKLKLDVDIISKTTGLTLEEISKIQTTLES